jgi:hypothetical protein
MFISLVKLKPERPQPLLVNFQTTQLTVSAISGSTSSSKQKSNHLFLFLKSFFPNLCIPRPYFLIFFYTFIQHFGGIDNNVYFFVSGFLLTMSPFSFSQPSCKRVKKKLGVESQSCPLFYQKEWCQIFLARHCTVTFQKFFWHSFET